MSKIKLIIFSIAVILLTACHSDIPMVSLGIDSDYVVERMRLLRLHPEFTGSSYRWTLRGSSSQPDSVLSTERDLLFVPADTGTYRLHLDIADADNPVSTDTRVTVTDEEVAYSPYISSVYEYRPAPGQFVNNMPCYEKGNTAEDMRRKAEESISGTNDVMVSLGSWGGYVTFGFDHTVANIPGEYDFKIYGNAFYAAQAQKENGGSAEPGIVEVSLDVNGNGLPDDPWYELAGSEYYKPETLHGYSMTYHRTPEGHIPIPSSNLSVNDSTYILWTDSRGGHGYVEKNKYHSQSYYPEWISADSMTFRGSRLAPNAVDESGRGRYYVLYAYDWGYADNHPNDVDHKACFNIDWAVDADGRKVHLPGADFIRVYTGVNQTCGWIGETSTEICRGEDLHLKPDE